MTANQSIKDLARDEQPRERLLLHGKESLSNSELLALLLGSGSKHQNVLELSRNVLKRIDGQIHRLSEMSIAELLSIKGIGEAKAVKLIAAMELAKRKTLSKQGKVELISSSTDAYQFFYPHLENKPYEEFWILLLNRRNQIIRPFRISEGGVSGTLADPKKIFKAALDNNASGLILCHNHPSGNTKPSGADKRLTERIKTAAAHLDIQLLDHLIIVLGDYYSFADHGDL